MPRTSPNFINGVPEMLLLQLLSEREMYGYELVKSIQVRNKNTLNFGEGCIYPILHSLEASKLVRSKRREVDGRTRNYYQIIAKGKKRLSALTDAWNEVGAGVAAIWSSQHA